MTGNALYAGRQRANSKKSRELVYIRNNMVQEGTRYGNSLTEGVYWVGVVDWALRAFHGHELSTHRGSTYNSYLIIDEKIVLVDTVWGPFQDQLIENIREVIDPAKIDIVVANHAETDHSGSLPAVMRQHQTLRSLFLKEAEKVLKAIIISHGTSRQ